MGKRSNRKSLAAMSRAYSASLDKQRKEEKMSNQPAAGSLTWEAAERICKTANLINLRLNDDRNLVADTLDGVTLNLAQVLINTYAIKKVSFNEEIEVTPHDVETMLSTLYQYPAE